MKCSIKVFHDLRKHTFSKISLVFNEKNSWICNFRVIAVKQKVDFILKLGKEFLAPPIFLFY